MNIVHNRSNTLTLYPNQNSSFTIIWLEMDTWNPPVCVLHTPNSYNCQHINTDQYRPPQCKVIWFTKYIHQTPFIYLSCWKITHSLSLSLSLSHTHTHTHTYTHTHTNCSLESWMNLSKYFRGNQMVNHTIISKYWQQEASI